MAGQLALYGSKSHVANNINTVCAQAESVNMTFITFIDKRVFMKDASANQTDTASVIKDMIAFRD
jgi:hypothetical protein